VHSGPTTGPAQLGSTHWLPAPERTAQAMPLHPQLGTNSAMHALEKEVLLLLLRML
jgi:hypothetical protein